MNTYGAIAIAVAWFAWTAFAGSDGVLAAEPAEGGTAQTSTEPAEQPSAQKQRQAVPRRDDKQSAQAVDKRPLDLSLPPEALETADAQDPTATSLYRGLPGLQDARQRNNPLRQMRQAFPALLAPQDEDNPIRIKGRLLMDESKERSPDAVDGGQLIIEVQTE